MRAPRIFGTIGELARRLARGISVGQQFAFIDLAEIELDSYELAEPLATEFARSAGRRCTMFLSGDKRIELPGLAIIPAPAPELSLRSITTDRDLYRCDVDVIHVLVIDLDAADRDVTVKIFSGGIEVDQSVVRLNAAGMAIVEFRQLPIGDYDVLRGERHDVQDSCKFRVAGFELAPLVATLQAMRLQGANLSVGLRLFRFGAPLSGVVRVDLYDGTQRIDSRMVAVEEGVADVSLEIQGQGPHRLELVLTSDRSATATIPLPGSSSRERAETVLSACGPTLEASLMPRGDACETLGLYVRETSFHDAPIQIFDTHRSAARLVVTQEIEAVCVVLQPFARSDGHRRGQAEIHRYERLKAGESLVFDLPPGAGILSVAGFVAATPWETRAITVRPAECLTSIELLSSEAFEEASCGEVGKRIFEPGESITVVVETLSRCDGFAAVTVRDSRLQPSERPTQHLAAQIKEGAKRAEPGIVPVEPAIRGRLRSWEQELHYRAARVRSPFINEGTLNQLVERKVISEQQAADVRTVPRGAGPGYYDRLIERGYADANTICRAIAAIYSLAFVNLDGTTLDEGVLELCPESVARENSALPLREDETGCLHFAMSDPFDLETIDKLRFILNRKIQPAVATPEAIVEAIEVAYGSLTEIYAETMLQEFTDTAIDFCDTGLYLFNDTAPPPRSAVSTESESGANATDIPSIRDDADVLLCELVEVRQGIAKIPLTVPDRLCRYTVDVLVVARGEWDHAETTFAADFDPYVDLQLPEAILEGDHAVGRVVARSGGEKFQLEVRRNGELVPLYLPGAKSPLVVEGEVFSSSLELTFVADVGTYVATVRDVETGRRRELTRVVRPLGKLDVPRRLLRLLSPGESVSLNDEIRGIRILPGVEPFQQRIAQATADYEHLCCEQTAAKLFSSFVCLINAHANQQSLRPALQAIRAGLARQKKMWVPGKGFAAYPDGRHFYSELGKWGTENLLKINYLQERVSSIPEAIPMLRDALRLGEEAAQQYQLGWPPNRLRTCQGAYAALFFGAQRFAEVRDVIAEQLRRERPRFYERTHWRQERAFALACLLRNGDDADILRGVKLANELLDDLGPKGMLYSTIDSVALMVMMLELTRLAWSRKDRRLTINGESTSPERLLRLETPIQSIRCDAGEVAVELVGRHRTDWTNLESNVPIDVALQQGGRAVDQVNEGASLMLHVSIKTGYRPGDLIWVALPPALSRLDGGGQVKQFAIDPQGESEVDVRLAATSRTFHWSKGPAAQHFLVVLRNMYDEGRIGSLGPIPVQVGD